MPPSKHRDPSKPDAVAAEAPRSPAERGKGYQAQAPRMHPRFCGRCSPGFSSASPHALTAHHRDRDHDHDNSAAGGSAEKGGAGSRRQPRRSTP